MRKTLLALLISAAVAGAAQQLWDPADLWKWRTSSDARIRADGEWVIYAEGWSDRAADAFYANLWAVATGQKQRIRLTDGAWRDASPRWSPDGSRVAWIRKSSGDTELRATQFDTREARHEEALLASGPLERFAWAPDGKSIVFTKRIDAPPAAPWCLSADLLALPFGRVPQRLRWFVVAAAGGTAQRIPTGDIDAAGEPAWLADGQSIVSATADGEIYSIQVADGAARRLTAGARINQDPVVSPDGAHIAFLSTDSAPRSYSIRKPMVMNADGSGVKVLAGALDRDASDPQWSSDSRTLYFLADDRGSTHVYAARSDGSTRQATNAPERLCGFTLADNGRAASVRSTAARAEEVVTFAVDLAPSPLVLAVPDEPLIAERRTAAGREINFASDGKTIQGWLTEPPGFDASKQYPLLLDIADAPRRMFGVEFSPEAQIYAALGYAVLRTNPRGTPGYGEEFGYLLPSRFPGDDADDLQRGIDFVLAQASAAQVPVDPHRLFVRGGLLAAWLVGHTDRFRAAVARHAMVDWTLDVLTAPDGARHAVAWMNAMPWEDPDQYTRHSPVYFAGNFKTPMLVLAGESDPQADELYSALRARRVDSELVRVAGDGKPSAWELEMEAMLAWFDRAAGDRRKPR